MAAGQIQTVPPHGAATGFKRQKFPAILKATVPPPRTVENSTIERGYALADTTKITDKLERKKVKRAARKKAAPKAKRTTPRGSNKKKVKKLARGQSKR
jgi:hypothetical protein